MSKGKKKAPKRLTATVHWKSRRHCAPARRTADYICEQGQTALAPKGHPLVVQSASETTASTTEGSGLFCRRAWVALPPLLSLFLPSPPTHPVGPVTWGPILWFTAMRRFHQHQISVSNRSDLIKHLLERQTLFRCIQKEGFNALSSHLH